MLKHRCFYFTLIVLLTGSICHVPSVIFAEEAVISATSNEDASQTGNAVEETRKKKKQTITVALWLLMGIGFLGVIMWAFVMILGHRMRRIAHKPTPQSGEVDELWYLKLKKHTLESSSPGDPESERDTGENDEE